jgi:hypothetical protein
VDLQSFRCCRIPIPMTSYLLLIQQNYQHIVSRSLRSSVEDSRLAGFRLEISIMCFSAITRFFFLTFFNHRTTSTPNNYSNKHFGLSNRIMFSQCISFSDKAIAILKELLATSAARHYVPPFFVLVTLFILSFSEQQKNI